MNPIAKKVYKSEFETSNISLEDLILKYNIDKEDLGDTSEWEKRKKIITKEPAHNVTTTDKTLVTGEEFLDDIQKAKVLALESTKEFFEEFDINEVTTKEFKDMVGVLKDLEAGELLRQGKGDTGTTVNVLVQNITEGFRDDC